MKSLVNEFSRFARLPRAKLEPCSLYEIVEEGLGLYRHNFSSISFHLEKDEDMPALRLDRDQFRQVIINLLENSVHAIGPRSRRNLDPALVRPGPEDRPAGVRRYRARDCARKQAESF